MTKKTDFKNINALEDAFQVTGRPKTPEFADVPEDMREWFKGLYNAAVVAEAINDGWRADWSDPSQKKYIPWFDTSSGFAFCATYWYYANAHAGDASRLCFETEAKAKHAGCKFTDIFTSILTK